MNYKTVSILLAVVLAIVTAVLAWVTIFNHADGTDAPRGIDFSATETNSLGTTKEEFFDAFQEVWHERTPSEQAETCRINEESPGIVRLSALGAYDDIISADWFVEFTDYVCGQ